MKFNSKLSLASAALLVIAASPGANADPASNLGTLSGNVTLTGTLSSETQVVEEMFTTASVTDFTAFTTAYGGGTNLDGTTTPAGGFQPNLTLYTSAGSYLWSQSVTSPLAKTDSKTTLALDGYLNDPSLAAGSYILTLTDWQNQQPVTATNLSDGFNGPGGTAFLDEGGNTRTGNYALNISSTSSSTTPEPATFWLILPVLAAAAVFFRRRHSSVS